MWLEGPPIIITVTDRAGHKVAITVPDEWPGWPDLLATSLAVLSVWPRVIPAQGDNSSVDTVILCCLGKLKPQLCDDEMTRGHKVITCVQEVMFSPASIGLSVSLLARLSKIYFLLRWKRIKALLHRLYVDGPAQHPRCVLACCQPYTGGGKGRPQWPLTTMNCWCTVSHQELQKLDKIFRSVGSAYLINVRLVTHIRSKRSAVCPSAGVQGFLWCSSSISSDQLEIKMCTSGPRVCLMHLRSPLTDFKFSTFAGFVPSLKCRTDLWVNISRRCQSAHVALSPWSDRIRVWSRDVFLF